MSEHKVVKEYSYTSDISTRLDEWWDTRDTKIDYEMPVKHPSEKDE